MDNTIKVTFGTTTSYSSKLVSSSTKVSDFLQSNNIPTAGATVQLDGAPVRDLDKTFAELGVTEECTLFSIVNAKNA